MSTPKAFGAPGWIVTFADLMALLLTFFVLLLSFADMDKAKYQAMIEAMARAFGSPPAVIGDHPGSVIELPQPQPIQRPRHDPQTLQDDLEHTLADELARRDVTLQRRADGLLIRFPERIAFPSGRAELTPELRDMLDKIAPQLQNHRGPLIVTGHSDDRPLVQPNRYRSNWDLSAARAVSVVHYLIDPLHIPPHRLTAQGQADTRPLFPNDTPSHRAANRRIELLLQFPQRSRQTNKNPATGGV